MPKGVKMEKYRPKIHFSAEDYIINDPNGLVDYKGNIIFFISIILTSRFIGDMQ